MMGNVPNSPLSKPLQLQLLTLINPSLDPLEVGLTRSFGTYELPLLESSLGPSQRCGAHIPLLQSFEDLLNPYQVGLPCVGYFKRNIYNRRVQHVPDIPQPIIQQQQLVSPLTLIQPQQLSTTQPVSVSVTSVNIDTSTQHTRNRTLNQQQNPNPLNSRKLAPNSINTKLKSLTPFTSPNTNNNKYATTTKGDRMDDALSRDDLLSFVNINNKLQPIDEMVNNIISSWQYNSQVFILSSNESNEYEIKENKMRYNNEIGLKEWKSNETILENILLEINSMRENNTYENESQQELHALVLDLITQKMTLLKYLGSVHKSKGKQMSQIMFEAQKRINMLQNDLVKKNREMAIHLKVKEKMYDEIKTVQQKVENLTREYQTIVNELDHVRQGRVDSIDSSFS